MDVHIGDGDVEGAADVAGNSINVLRGRPVLGFVAIHGNGLAVRFEAAVRQHRDSIRSFGCGVRVLESLIGIASDLLTSGPGAIANFRQVFFIHQVRHHFVIHLDEAHGIVCDFFSASGDERDVSAGPLQLSACG